MSDSGTDSFVGVVLVLVAVVAVVASVNGRPLAAPTGGADPSSTRTTTASARTVTRSSTNIPGGPLFACTGEVIANQTAGRGRSALNVKVYYSPTAGGRNCAVATKVDTKNARRGQVRITLRFAESKSTSWPKLAEHRSGASASRSGSVYLDDTDNKCVTAQARLIPADGGKAVTVSSGRTGCG